MLYDGFEDYIAPEVLAGGEITARADVYSFAKFVCWLYQSAGLPLEWKYVISRATAENPERRYASVKELYNALVNFKSMRRTALVGFAAIAIALAIVGGYFYMLPQPDDIEYVKAVEEPIPDDMLDENGELYGLGADADSAVIANIVAKQKHLRDSLGIDEKEMKAYQAKAEQIFRKQYTKAADLILSKIYNNERMNNTEKNFKATSEEVMKELVQKQREMAANSALSDETAQRIASEIIEQLTEKKKAELAKKEKEE